MIRTFSGKTIDFENISLIENNLVFTDDKKLFSLNILTVQFQS